MNTAKLEAAAQHWNGTPWRDNSAVRGEGANCVGAVAGVLRDAGLALPDIPNGPSNWAKHQSHSLMEAWLDSHPEIFQPVEIDDLRPGDVLGFSVGRCIHHLGVLLPGGRWIQCNSTMGTAILSTAEPVFKRRLTRAWRPNGMEH
jgi:cell wall-associated NlpC family hydrolase